ncbi:MAG: ABC transporter permease subunit [Clostridiaceae bacterium]|nr:ABC transporter permease subunit [Clostridiaceae bacterium]
MTVDRPATRSARFIKGLRQVFTCWQLYTLLLPGIIYLFIFSYLPMYGLQIAFKNYRPSLGIWGSEWIGLKHFLRFFAFPDFWKYIRNTVTISVYGICTFPIGIIFALMINELQNQKFKKTVQMLTYAPHFISTVVVCGMVLLFFNTSYGFVNNIRELFGAERVAFLEEARYFRSLYIGSGIWQGLGWSTIIYLAALSGVSPELVEAARIDGATRFQIVRYVNVPTIMPTITILFIMNFGSILSVGFEKIYLLQNALNLSVSQVISTYVYQVGLISAQYSYSSAIGLFNTIINITLLIVVNLIVSKVTEISLW